MLREETMANLWPTSLWPRVSATSVLEDTQTPFLSVASFLAAIVAVDAVVAARRSTTTSHTHTHTRKKPRKQMKRNAERPEMSYRSVSAINPSLRPHLGRLCDRVFFISVRFYFGLVCCCFFFAEFCQSRVSVDGRHFFFWAARRRVETVSSGFPLALQRVPVEMRGQSQSRAPIIATGRSIYNGDEEARQPIK